jgi:hypothetical protein
MLILKEKKRWCSSGKQRSHPWLSRIQLKHDGNGDFATKTTLKTVQFRRMSHSPRLSSLLTSPFLSPVALDDAATSSCDVSDYLHSTRHETLSLKPARMPLIFVYQSRHSVQEPPAMTLSVSIGSHPKHQICTCRALSKGVATIAARDVHV